MSTRVAVISIIVEDVNLVDTINELLSSCREFIIGRMGLPYKAKNINIINIAIDAPEETINSLAGKIGRLKGVSAKINFSNVIS